jgi:hypothetical protein
MVKGSTPSYIGVFPIGKSTPLMLRFTRPTKPRTPNSDARVLSSCHVTSPSVYRGSRDRDFAVHNSFAMESPECRIPISRDLVPHCHVTSGFRGSRIHDARVPRRREPRIPEPRFLGILRRCPTKSTVPIRSGNRRFAISTNAKLLPPQTPKTESRWPLVLFPAPKD